MEYAIDYTAQAIKDLKQLRKSEPAAYKKFLRLKEEIERHPTTGTGKPHELRGDKAGLWSRRITDKHRLVYSISDTTVTVLVLKAYGHYDDK